MDEEGRFPYAAADAADDDPGVAADAATGIERIVVSERGG